MPDRSLEECCLHRVSDLLTICSPAGQQLEHAMVGVEDRSLAAAGGSHRRARPQPHVAVADLVNRADDVGCEERGGGNEYVLVDAGREADAKAEQEVPAE